MSATPEATVRADLRTRNPDRRVLKPDTRTLGRGPRVAAGAAVALFAVLGSVLGGCKTSPHADRGSGATKSGGRGDSGSTSDPASNGKSDGDLSPEMARLIRIDSMVREWDAAQGEGRADAARKLADTIAGEVDRDFGYFASGAKGEKGLRVQNLAVEALAFSRNRAATGLLVDRLRDGDGSVVGNALIGLKIRSDPDTPLKPLVALIRSNNDEARRYAPLAFANVVRAREDAHRPIEPDLSDDAMAGLVALVRDRDPYARLHAAKAMGALRRTDATDFLVLLLNDDRATIRIAAAAALERIGDPRAFPSVVALLERMPDEQKSFVRDILVSYAERLQGRPMSALEQKSLDVSARAWDRWFAARETAVAPPAPPPTRTAGP